MPQNIRHQSFTNTSTMEISIKETSQTLLDFPNKNPNMPEWRIKLQEAVRARREQKEIALAPMVKTKRRTHTGRNSGSVSMDVIERENIELPQNPILALAMQRIERSRQMFPIMEIEDSMPSNPASPAMDIKQNSGKTLQFAIPNRMLNTPAPSAPLKFEESRPADEFIADAPSENSIVAPRAIRIEEDKVIEEANTPKGLKIERYKTSKLPNLIPASISSSFGRAIARAEEALERKPQAKVHFSADADTDIHSENQIEEIEDIAPFAMRFNAALFDLIIGSFLSLILLSPLMLLGGSWFTIEGLFGFLATASVVMFIYLTTAIGLLGKTFGMILFNLEVVNIEDSDYPSFHQSAVNSSVYLLSLALGGIGFLTVFLNSEQRAAHDILAGTLVVREM